MYTFKVNTENSISSKERDSLLARRYNLVIGIFLSTLNVGFVVTSFGVFFKPVSADFGWTRAETSGAFSMSIIISGLAGIAAGKLSDRFSPRILIIVCGIMSGAAYILLSQMTSLWQLYLYYGILIGLGLANIVPASSIVTRWFSRQRGRMTGIALSGAAFSSVFSPYLATWLIESYSWQISFAAIGGLCLVIIGVAALFMFRAGKERLLPKQKEPQSKSQVPVTGKSLKAILCSWPFWCLALVYFCFHFSLSVVQVHIVPHATDLGISAILAASILTISNGANVAGSFVLGGTNDRIGGRKSLVLGLAIMVVGSILLLISDVFWLLCLFAIIFGFAWGGVGSLRSLMVADLFGLGSHGVLVGAIMFVALLGGTLSPILSGYIFDVTGQYRIAFLLIIGLSVIAVILSLFLSPRHHRERK